jgi:hypothetical protein
MGIEAYFETTPEDNVEPWHKYVDEPPRNEIFVVPTMNSEEICSVFLRPCVSVKSKQWKVPHLWSFEPVTKEFKII